MIGILDYGAGNLFSLQCAFDRIGAPHRMVYSPDDFEGCDHYVIPGVGNAKPAIEKLRKTLLIPLLQKTKKPVLGLCLGMQLLTESSEEGRSNLLGVVPLRTRKLSTAPLKCPQVGWNKVFPINNSRLFHNIQAGEYFYFVHSYYVEEDERFTIGRTMYGVPFSAAIQKNNFFGVQFHPEKSGNAGQQLLQNFVEF